MWRNKRAQEFWSDRRQQVATRLRERLAILGVLGGMALVAVYFGSKAPAASALSTQQRLESADPQLGVTSKILSENHPAASTAIAQIPTLPPTTLPPAVFPTNQTPTVSVPPLQPLPNPTPTPVITSQPLKPSTESASPALSNSPVIEFGQPLPKTTREFPLPIPQSALPALELSTAVSFKLV